MAFWSVREALSQADRLRRSYYELLRDELDQFVLQYALIDSYNLFVASKTPYPFVEKRELKPRARIPVVEYGCQNVFLVLFVEDTIPPANKKYIRFFDDNKTTKINLLRSEALPLAGKFDRSQKYLDSTHFYNFLKVLIPVDYALLIQRDHTSRSKNRYSLSHFTFGSTGRLPMPLKIWPGIFATYQRIFMKRAKNTLRIFKKSFLNTMEFR